MKGPLLDTAVELPDRIARALARGVGLAIKRGNVEVDWPQLASRVRAVNDGLARSGIGAGATVAILGRNEISSAVALLATIVGKRCVAIVNPFRPADAVMLGAREHAPAVILMAEDDPALTSVEAADPILVMAEDGSVRRLGGVPRRDEARKRAGLVLSTSGTTREPTAHFLGLDTLSRAIPEIQTINAGFGDQSRKDGAWPALIQYTPLAHVGGALTLLRAIALERALVMLGKFNPHEWAEVVEEFAPFTTGLPPSMLRMVLDAEIEPDRMASLVSVWSGSAPSRPEDQKRFTARYGLPVLGNYGATEFCGAIAAWSLDDYRRYVDSRSQAVGRIDPRVAEARVRSKEGEVPDRPGAVGALEFRVGRIGDHWIRTNDLGSVDREGFLVLHGRTDDAIVRGGFKLLPRTIADVLREHPAIRDAAVVGIVDERLGQVPVAAVELKRQVEVDCAELQAFVRARLPAYYVPVDVCAVRQLPRTMAMKLDRRAIARLFES